MNELIPVINKIQQIFCTVGSEALELPQIVAVGTQSSGKSSVIESIIGRDFLPRGSGMVTRRPIIIQLNCLKDEKDKNLSMWAEFSHHPNKKFVNFNEVHDEIIAETKRVLDDRKDICPQPILLKIFSPNLVNLTLIDLPGLTRIPLDSQPQDIESRISQLTLDFIKNKNSIILAIIPANIDIATSEALWMAKEVDPNGERTIVCLTKLDLMDKGTSASNILEGKVIQMKLGIIGVVNRSQFELDDKKSIEEARKDEYKFFNINYPLFVERSGTQFLVKKLNKALLTHIHNCLPHLKERVQNLLSKYTWLVDKYGSPLIDRKYSLILIINKFVSIYSNIVHGSTSLMKTDELFGGSRIYYIYHRIFSNQIASISPLEGITNEDILTAMVNCKGMKTNIFFPEGAFDFLVKKQIKKLEKPALDCLYLVNEEMIKIIKQSSDQITEFSRFNNLNQHVSNEVKKILSEELKPTQKMIKNLIKAEMTYINTNHPDFAIELKSLNNKVTNLYQQTTQIPKDLSLIEKSMKNTDSYDIIESSTQSEDDLNAIHLKLLKNLISSYIKITKNKYQDMVPKFITCFLVEKTIERIPNELIDKLINESLLDEILLESEELVKEKQRNIEMHKALLHSSSLIAQIKEENI